MLLVENLIKEPREARTTHLALNEPCIERGGNSTNHRGVLAEYLNTNIPAGYGVNLCHACHNAKCSNPRHLYWGTPKDNIEDSISNGTFMNPYEAVVRKYGLEAVTDLKRTWAKGGKSKSKTERV